MDNPSSWGATFSSEGGYTFGPKPSDAYESASFVAVEADQPLRGARGRRVASGTQDVVNPGDEAGPLKKNNTTELSSLVHSEQVRVDRVDSRTLMCKRHTFAGGTETAWTRREGVKVAPAARVQLHKLHEVFRKMKNPGQTLREDTSEMALNAAARARSGWHVFANPPPDIEAPFHARDLGCLPERGAKGALRLASVGAVVLNTKGRKSQRDKTIGQDSFCISRLPSGWMLYCVLDGHGDFGHWPSLRAARTLPFFLQGKSCDMMLRQSEVEAAISHAFEKVQMDLVRKAHAEDVDLQASGSTAVCIFRPPGDSNYLWFAHVGDSRAIVFVPGQGVLFQTEDHKPGLPRERQRVEAAGGEVSIEEYEDGFVDERVNLKGEEFPGIGMTRSFGDLSVKECGVIAEPEVVRWRIEDSDLKHALIVAASDGVWDFLGTEGVTDIITTSLQQSPSLDKAVESVLKAARAAWVEEEGLYCDDITIILAYADGRPRGRSTGTATCCDKQCVVQ